MEKFKTMSDLKKNILERSGFRVYVRKVVSTVRELLQQEDVENIRPTLESHKINLEKQQEQIETLNVGARLKFWRRSRVLKKGSRDEAVFLAASPLVTAPPSNLTRLYCNGSAAKSHSTATQYRQLRRLWELRPKLFRVCF